MASKQRNDPIVGIDLGTTNSLVAVCDESGPRVLLARNGAGGLLPSVVRFERVGEVIRRTVGLEAKESSPQFPRNTISSVKRLMGRSIADASADLAYLSFEVVAGEQDTARVRIPAAALGGKELIVSPQEVSAEILRALKARATEALGVEVTRAVVTVPAYFDDAQRQATRDAGRLAGLEVVRIVNEPTAAALAYGLGLERQAARNQTTETVAVYDLGGGTFDVSILKLTPAAEEGGRAFFQVLATAGDTHLGGDDMDAALVAWVIDAEKVQSKLSAGDMRRLVMECERVKRELSEGERAALKVELVDAGLRIERVVERTQFEALIEPLLQRTLASCARAMADAKAKLGPEGVQAVVMVGGATRVPRVQQAVGEFFGLAPYTAINPDEVVALGASVQGAILSGLNKSALLLDVVPLSLGIETVGGAVAKLIVRNSTVPTRAREMFSTSVDGQTSIRLRVYQGEREMAADCRVLGEFHVRGIPPMPAGVPQLEVEFLVDANGVLNVSAHERRSGKRAQLQVVPNHGLTREEVDRMESESISFAREDMTRHRIVDLIVNSKLDVKWISERLEKLRPRLEAEYASGLDVRISKLRGFIARAETSWKDVGADEFASVKNDLDQASIRLQEVGITESLRADQADRK